MEPKLSVFARNSTWYLSYRDRAGRRVQHALPVNTRTEAVAFSGELARVLERIRAATTTRGQH